MFGALPGASLPAMVAVAQILGYMATGSAPPRRVLARIAAAQHGVVSRAQILALGVHVSFIRDGVAAGRLHQVHLGVFAVGHRRITEHGRWMAAVLAAGESGVLSHLSAALLWGLVDRGSSLVHVVVPGPSGHRRPGLAMHRTRYLPAGHRTEVDGIPVTTPHRTLIDLAALLPARKLRFAVEAADRLGLLDVAALCALCDASNGKRGIGRLRRIALEQRGPISRTKSRPERLFLRLCLKRRLPVPQVNVDIAGYEVDFYWPQARLVVEIDSYTFHSSWAQVQRDHRRDAGLKTKGDDVLRYTEDRLLSDEDGVFAQVETMLAAATG